MNSLSWCGLQGEPTRKHVRRLTQEITINELKDKELIPYDLLLVADPSRRNIDKYISGSMIFAAALSGVIVGCYVLCSVDKKTLEIKNIVVDEKFQGKGIGTILLKDAITKGKANGFKEIIIGTGNSSIGQLYLYQKAGFRITGIKVDFFRDNYGDPIIENGIECRDMIVLTRTL